MTPDTVPVRLRWANGEIITLREPVDAAITVIQRVDADGDWHSFRESDEIDAEGYVIFIEDESQARTQEEDLR